MNESSDTSGEPGVVTERPAIPREVQLQPAEVRSRALSGVVALAMRSVAIRGLGFVANLVLARLLVPRDFGNLAFGLAIVAVGSFITNGGLGVGLVQQRDPPSRAQLQSVLGVQLLAASVAAAAIAAIGVPLGKGGAIAAIMALSLPLDALRAPAALMTERALTYRPVVRAEVAEMAIYNVVAVGSVVLGAGVWGVAVATACRALTGTLVLTRSSGVGIPRPRLSLAPVKPLLRFGLIFQGVGLVGLARDTGINVLTSGLAGTAALGLFSFSQSLLSPIWLLFESTVRISFPAFTRLLEADDREARVSVARALRVTAVVTGLAAAAVGAAAPAAIPSVFGTKWSGAIPLVPLVLAGVLLNGPILVCANGYFAATGEVNRVLRSVLLEIVVWFAVMIPLLPSLGATATATGWAAASFADLLYFGVILHRRQVVTVGRVMAPPLFGAAIGGCTGWLASRPLGATLPAGAFAGLIGAVVYLVVLWLLQRAALIDLAQLIRRAVGRSAAGLPGERPG